MLFGHSECFDCPNDRKLLEYTTLSRDFNSEVYFRQKCADILILLKLIKSTQIRGILYDNGKILHILMCKICICKILVHDDVMTCSCKEMKAWVTAGEYRTRVKRDDNK